MRNIIRKLTLVVATFVAVASAQAQAQEKTITIGTMGWEDLLPVSLITKKFMEKEGYKVELVKFSEWGIAFGALSKGDADILVSQINYVASDYWEKNKTKLEKISVVSHGLFQGLVVPSYVPVDSVDQLNQISDKVGGKIIGIEPGSGLMREVGEAVKAYGLNYKVVEGSTAAMTAELQSTMQRKEPIVTMLWKPSWMVMKYDVKFLKDPKHIFAPPQSYYWIGKRGFSAKDPHAREALASVYVPIEDITAINGEVKDGKTFDQAVDDWWNQNKDLVDRWSVMAEK
ncbi:glycine betaine ABC transporter substrate-binding protein [Mesorhizobium sp. WSM3860]|uniref:glycine betaine ABC transporter substrate-binding protein n=1 Tax=Mesorhizobium sp. WSM3860 TaxID=2029403 RepID=UPI000BAFE7A9|nr:glycine betaine ABC transporter substrate-binding protein [Mesorhizobium sp. WSM3860]PBC02333.1 glycine/betaine ABC transporter [Mesorhizobium sp. WSM3860]